MRASSTFGDILEAAERLSLEERESLAEVLRNRTIEERRAGLKRDIAAAKREYAAGKCKPATVSQIMQEILK